jgi:hypothetical protein
MSATHVLIIPVVMRPSPSIVIVIIVTSVIHVVFLLGLEVSLVHVFLWCVCVSVCFRPAKVMTNPGQTLFGSRPGYLRLLYAEDEERDNLRTCYNGCAEMRRDAENYGRFLPL